MVDTLQHAYENGIGRCLSSSPGEGRRPEYSPADVYSFVTKHLGFKRVQHEGKVTGLAAHGDPDRLYAHFEKLTYLETESRTFRSAIPYDRFRTKFARTIALGTPYDTGLLEYFRREFDGESREDIAAALQKRCEDLARDYVTLHLEASPSRKILLSGGLFANVQINQIVSEIDGVDEIYVHPCMGDGGLAAGACFLHYERSQRKLGRVWVGDRIDDVYLGPDYSETQVERALAASGLRYFKSKSPSGDMATLFSKRRVVGHFSGRMEYGPRALGNRSLLYAPDDPAVNAQLNHRLHRTEFMPFAPMCLAECAPDLFEAFHAGRTAAQFMTTTFEIRPEWRHRLAGVCHIDQTARPQTIRADQNPRVHGILEAYRRITGTPALINTSFNIHGEPIVCTPEDAIRSFKADACDVLVLNDFICEKPS